MPVLALQAASVAGCCIAGLKESAQGRHFTLCIRVPASTIGFAVLTAFAPEAAVHNHQVLRTEPSLVTFLAAERGHHIRSRRSFSKTLLVSAPAMSSSR